MGICLGKQENPEDIRERYELGDVIGSGSFGQVRVATLKSDQTVQRAVKIIERDDESDDEEAGSKGKKGKGGKSKDDKGKGKKEQRPSSVSDDSSDDEENSKAAMVMQEVKTMSQLKHPNIIEFFEFYEDPAFMYWIAMCESCSHDRYSERDVYSSANLIGSVRCAVRGATRSSPNCAWRKGDLSAAPRCSYSSRPLRVVDSRQESRSRDGDTVVANET